MSTYEFKDDQEYIDFLRWKLERDKIDYDARITVIEDKLSELSVPLDIASDIIEKVGLLEKGLFNTRSFLDMINERLSILESMDFMLMDDSKD